MKLTSISLLFLFTTTILVGQKRPLQQDDFDHWQTISAQKISNDGNWVVYHLKPGKGDVIMKLTNFHGDDQLTIERAEESFFSWDSKYLIFKIKPAIDSIYSLKRIKVKEEKHPKDTLAIYNLQTKTLQKIPRVKTFKVPEKWSTHIALFMEPLLEEKDTTQSDSVKTKKVIPKKMSKENGHHLIAYNLSTSQGDTIHYVCDFSLAKESSKMILHSNGKDSTLLNGVYFYDFQSAQLKPVCRAKKANFKQLSIYRLGTQLAFISDLDTTKALQRNPQLRYWTPTMDSAKVVVDKNSSAIPDNWLVNEHRKPDFSESGERLYFGTSPQPVVQDTSLLEHEIVNVEIWNYQNDRLHTQQNIELEEDKKKSYLAVYETQSSKTVQLANETMDELQYADKGDSQYALGISSAGYKKYLSWEGFPTRQDIFSVDLTSGERRVVVKDLRGSASISANGKYIFWHNAEDSTWYNYRCDTEQIHVLSKKITASVVDELNDQPNYPYPYGIAGWTVDDNNILIYDRFDIWLIDPDNKKNPVNLTNGRNEFTRYRYVDLDKEEQEIDPNYLLLHAFNEKNRNEGYYQLKIGKEKKKLIFDNYEYTSRPIKSENTERIVFTRENHNTYPDLVTAELNFKKINKISNAGEQQQQFLWSNVEVYKWTSLDGIELEGLLYKPEQFDPNKKYPMIVYFYERNSHNLNRYWGAIPSRSIINPAYYASNGYVVFIADIVYRTGYPGESCYNAVIPGVTSLINKGFIDKNKIGVQGHSWGGYQVAYLVTKTNIFAAAESGAPVSNMISAYGGIRWWTGLSRMFQYEHTQSRIGGTLWDYPIRYIENSPIFFMDKVETPLLIMHNDKDGHVPWYQGIEMYVALRRLGKPAWMLNYNDEPHWPTKWENIRDFNVRMEQFFNHYLKDQPMPIWMRSGIPATLKSIDKGYKLIND